MELKDLIGLGKAAEKALSVFERFGLVLVEPKRITRKAKAEAEAQVILAEGDAAAEAIRARAARRLAEDDLRHQANLDAITKRTLAALPPVANNAPLDSDWMDFFLESAKGFSNAQMQELWARLLANEIATPGSFSRRTIAMLRSLDSSDARMLTVLCQLAIRDGRHPYPIIAPHSAFAAERGIAFSMLSHLQTIGLITFSPEGTYCL